MEKIILTPRGNRWRVAHEGRTLIESARCPEYSACGALLGMGKTGRLEVWHVGSRHAASTVDIVAGAKLTTAEKDREGLRLGPWQPMPSRLTPRAPEFRDEELAS